MPLFTYIASNANNELIKGHLETVDRGAVASALQKQGLRPLSIRERSSTTRIKSSKGGLLPKKVKMNDLVMFTRELSAMVGAGVPLLRSLTSLEEHSESPALKKVLVAVIQDVESGDGIADALSKHPAVFDDVYVNMVRAGEAAGILDDILKRLAIQQEKNATIKKKIKSAMTYPMVLVGITVIAFFGLMLFVIPQIGNIIKDLGGEDAELPALTQFMLGISDFIINFWFIVIPVFVGMIFALLRWLKTPKGKALFHQWILKAPGIGSLVQKIAIARFARTFSALIGAGVAVLEALNVTAHAAGNTMYEKALIDAAEQVKNGVSLSSVIGKNPIFPAIVSQMLAVGEETGQTDTVLVKVADFYEEEVDVAIEGISSIIEPVMILFMGSMVGLIAASVMGPIASMSQSIQG